jgi:hypothetical protein
MPTDVIPGNPKAWELEKLHETVQILMTKSSNWQESNRHRDWTMDIPRRSTLHPGRVQSSMPWWHNQRVTCSELPWEEHDDDDRQHVIVRAYTWAKKWSSVISGKKFKFKVSFERGPQPFGQSISRKYSMDPLSIIDTHCIYLCLESTSMI